MTTYSDIWTATSIDVIRNFANSWESENSVVTSLPQFSIADLFSGSKFRNASISSVRINGPSTEGLHFHTSHLVGLVVLGTGWFTYVDVNDNIIKATVSAGDLVVIPEGKLHIFETKSDQQLEYIAFEVSRHKIDYQKHFK